MVTGIHVRIVFVKAYKYMCIRHISALYTYKLCIRHISALTL